MAKYPDEKDCSIIYENISRDMDIKNWEFILKRLIPVLANEWGFTSLISYRMNYFRPPHKLTHDLRLLHEKGILIIKTNKKISYPPLPRNINPNKAKWAYKLNPIYLNGTQLKLVTNESAQ